MKKCEVTGSMKRLLATSGWVNVPVLFFCVFNIWHVYGTSFLEVQIILKVFLHSHS